ncbi:chemokine (C motif) receptor 1a, duplicate 1 [Lampris incognitus]|uniref:chemokine (C motif) receptor 1a, duplicate 1 n=1 Tax=Lampris incognitus TaxID=2546036 RepID=UPI0024B53B8B|nr:chemokine (C motif) receptor 1a, duplicate 1 [Lampris incognitus]
MNASLNDSEYGYDDYGDEVCDKDEVVRFESIAIPLFFSLVITLSLIGNVLVLVILALYENFKSLTNIFILNLAISDLIFTAGLPFWAIYHVWGWVLSDILCKMVTFVFFIGFYSSIMFLTVMTIHRYLVVVYPLSEHGMQKVSYRVLVSVIVWLTSIGAAMPSLLFSTIIVFHHKDGDSFGCEYGVHLWKYVSTYQQVIFFLVAFGIMGFCYVQILVKIAKTRCHMKSRTVKRIFCIVSVFFLGWIPYSVVIFLQTLADQAVPPLHECEASTRLDYAFYVCRLVAFSHCSLNPVFYAFVGVKFRNHMKSITLRLLRRQNRAEEQHIRMPNVQSNGTMS